MRKSGLPQKTWEWHELMAQSFSSSPTKSKSSFQSFTSTRGVTASLAVGWLKDPARRLVPQPGCQRQGEAGPKHRWPTQAARPISSLRRTPQAGGCRWLLPWAHPCTLLRARLSFPPPATCIRGLILPHPPFFFHLKVIAIPGAFILDDVVVVRWSTCSSQSAVDLNAGESQQWA